MLTIYYFLSSFTQWTPEGDAFIIGSDLKRLESETLPQFFRHNRFQSLVRQLNFYSFRKINRERNVWIYKHELFHRDRQEDLHLVRRRTCPGVDGRKQRFSRRVSETGTDALDDWSFDSTEENTTPAGDGKKRGIDASDRGKGGSTKRGRVLLSLSNVVNTAGMSMVQRLKEVSEGEDSDDQASLAPLKVDRSSRAEQSMIVSEVSMKLDEYARRARGVRRVVTPPFGSTAMGLLTYDDEYESLVGTLETSFASVVIPEAHRPATPEGPVLVMNAPEVVLTTPPVMDTAKAHSIANGILERSAPSDIPALAVPIAVSSFCMSTSPVGDKDLCSKILHLIASDDIISSEFHLYRSALDPMAGAYSPSYASSPPRVDARATTVQEIWQREASRGDAVRDFKTFAVNCVHTLHGKSTVLTMEEQRILQNTVELWQTSVGVFA